MPYVAKHLKNNPILWNIPVDAQEAIENGPNGSERRKRSASRSKRWTWATPLHADRVTVTFEMAGGNREKAVAELKKV